MKSLFPFVTLSLFLFYGCAKEEFAARSTVSTQNISSVEQYNYQLCATSTLVKPPVDFLFLWDNSSSQLFINSATKQALNNTINFIASNRFDYRIMLAPLVGSGNTSAYLIAENPTGLSQATQASMLISQEVAATKLDSFAIAGGSRESGIERARSLLASNITNGIFRKGAYTIIVLMSNGNDTDSIPEGEDYLVLNEQAYVAAQLNNYKTLRDITLQSKMMRFISLTAHNPCTRGDKIGSAYQRLSAQLYASDYPAGISRPTDQSSRATPDSYNICSTDFSHLFDGINSSIAAQVLAHTYNYWPITASGNILFDPASIKVTKIKANGSTEDIAESATNGFEYIGNTTVNTRLLPSVGEPYTGHLIKLNGTAQVSYPDCMKVETAAPFEYYGYIHLPSRPNPATIAVTINGAPVAESATDGWQYLGYFSNKNIKIKSPTQPTIEGTPAIYKTGYFLKVSGSAIYSNNTKISVKYDPQGG